MSRVTAIISALVICIIDSAACQPWAVNHYRGNAITYKASATKMLKTKLANAAITDMQMLRQRDVVALGKYTKS